MAPTALKRTISLPWSSVSCMMQCYVPLHHPITFLPLFLHPSYTDLLSALFYPQAFANGISFAWSILPKCSSSLTSSSGFSLSNSSIHFLHSVSTLCDYLISLCNYFLLPVPYTRMLVPLLTPDGVPGMNT